MMHDAFQFTQ